MAVDRSRYGLSMSALGAAVLAVSVFLPWYRISSLAHAAPLGGHALTLTSAHPALPVMKIVLLILAGLALLDALLPLLRTGAPVPGGAGGSVVLLGALAAALALYRILDPPGLSGNMVGLSLREGPWLALLASLAMVLGGMWPRRVGSGSPPELRIGGAWPGMPA
jgi:hypothetical protein